MQKQNGNAQDVSTDSQSQKTELPQAFKIDPQMKSLAKRFGIPLDKIIAYTTMQDARLKNVENAIVEIAKHIESSDQKLAPLVTAIEQAEAARAQAPPGSNPAAMPQGGMNIASLLQMLPSMLSGGGVDEEMRALNKRMMEMSLNRMQADIGFTEAIKNAVVTSIAGKAAKRIVE